MNFFKKEIVIKYSRIKKPAKNEFILFQFPEGMDVEFIMHFQDNLRRLVKSNHKYLIISGNIKVINGIKPNCLVSSTTKKRRDKHAKHRRRTNRR